MLVDVFIKNWKCLTVKPHNECKDITLFWCNEFHIYFQEQYIQQSKVFKSILYIWKKISLCSF